MTQRNKLLPACCLAALAAALAAPVHAQEAVPAISQQADEVLSEEELPLDDEGDVIVVRGTYNFGTVDAGVPPVDELDQADIAAYGAGSIADLVAALAPQTSGGRGRGGGQPVFLVNGMRVSSFREMRSYPPEALDKVEILPEEVAQRYGFPPDQRVINFILKPDFSSFQVEGEYEQPGIGGFHSKEVEATFLRLGRNNRLNFNVELSDTSPMTEAVRGIEQAEGSVPDVVGDPDPAAYRSLIADSRDLQLTGNFTTALGGSGASLSLNGTVEDSKSLSLSGLDSVLLTDPAGNSALRTFNADDPLETRTGSTTYSVGSTLSSTIGDWQLTGTVNGSLSDVTRTIDQRADTAALVAAAAAGSLAIDGALPAVAAGATDIAESRTTSADTKWTLNGSPFYLPAGDVSVTLDAGYDWLQLESSDTRTAFDTRLRRGTVNGGLNLAVPVTSRRDDFLGWAGDITLNFSAGVDHLSDFGTLTDWSAGLVWGLTDTLNVQTTYIARDSAPGLSQLGNPEVISYNVPYFDLARNETVLVTTTSGGNPFLSEEKQRDWRVAAFWDLPILDRASLSVEYNRNNSENVTASFPQLTPAIESAFADRVTRDAGGQLVALDLRPVTFAEQKSSRLTFGLNLSGPFGKARPEAEAAAPAPAAAPVPAASGMAPAGASGGFGGQGGGNFDPERFRQMRERMCGENFDPEVALTEEQIAQLPEPMLARLRGPDGEIDRERLKEMRLRICTSEGQPQGAAGDPGQGGAGAPPAGGPPQGARTGGGPGGRGGRRGPGFGRPGGDGQGRWFFNLNWTHELDNTVLIAPGLPVLDQLAGDSVSGSGTPQDTARLVGGMFYRGFGVRYSASYTGEATVLGSGLPGSTDLRFGSLATLDLRMFVDLGEQEKLVRDQPWLSGVRLAFVVDNVFDSRREVTDSDGNTPLRYQPLLLDPTGRYIGIDVRKVF